MTFSVVSPLVDLANAKPMHALRDSDAAFLVKAELDAAHMAHRFDETHDRLKV